MEESGSQYDEEDYPEEVSNQEEEEQDMGQEYSENPRSQHSQSNNSKVSAESSCNSSII